MKEGLLAIVKFFLFLLILPLLIATGSAFQTQILGLPVHKEQWLLWGAVVFVLLHLFLYSFKEVYTFGQTVVSNLLKFFEPLAAIGGLLVPIYTVLAICLYLVLNVLGLTAKYERILLLILGFSVAMHIVLTARQMYEADSNPIKAQYLSVFALVLVANLFIIALLLGLAVPEFSFVAFVQALAHHTASYYHAIYKVLFVPS